MSISNIKILLLNVNRTGWHSGNMIYDMECIKQACDTKIYGPGWPEYKYNDIREIIKQLYGSDKPDIIYSYFTPNERVGDVYMTHYKIDESLRFFPINLDKISGIRKIFGLSDFWARRPEQFSKDLRGSTFEYCFCCYTPPYSNPKDFYAFFDDQIRKEIKFIAHPRCVEKNCFRNYGLPKEHDVITVGSMCNFYPLRNLMHGYLLHNCDRMNIKYHNYPHCGTNFTHSDFVRDKYAMAINSSKILVSCGGRYHLAFNKIFEAMGCKTLYVGEKPYGEKELHLEDGINYVAVDSRNFVEKIMYYLNNSKETNCIINKADETFRTYHCIEVRAAEFVKKVKDILCENSCLFS